MFFVLILACVILLGWVGISVSEKSVPEPTVTPSPTPTSSLGCVCPAVYMPVCGVDGITYDNQCSADCKGVAIKRVGVC